MRVSFLEHYASRKRAELHVETCAVDVTQPLFAGRDRGEFQRPVANALVEWYVPGAVRRRNDLNCGEPACGGRWAALVKSALPFAYLVYLFLKGLGQRAPGNAYARVGREECLLAYALYPGGRYVGRSRKDHCQSKRQQHSHRQQGGDKRNAALAMSFVFNILFHNTPMSRSCQHSD